MQTTLISFSVLFLLPLHLQSQPQSSAARLSGIVNLPGLKVAVLNAPATSHERREQSILRGAQEFVLKENEREDDIEVLEIHPENGTVKLNPAGFVGSATLSLTNPTGRVSGTGPALALESAGMNPVLYLYGEFVNRTLLRHPALPEADFTLTAAATNKAEAASVLEKAFAEKGITTIKDGEKFIMVLPRERVASAHPRSSLLASSTNSAANSETLPPGMLDFRGADVMQVANVYASLLGRELDRSERLPFPGGSPIRLTTQTPINKAEALYALETVLGWAGLKFVCVDAQTIKAVAIPASTR